MEHAGLSYLSSFCRSALTPLEQIKVLFCFLLDKRYTDRLNLLYFAFRLFDDDCYPTSEVIAQVPFPHEDGIPGYAVRLDPDWEQTVSAEPLE